MRAALHMLMLLLALVAPGTAFAVQPSEVLPDRALEARARALSAELRCLVCQNQSIDDSDAPLAKDLRVLVRERLVAGDSDSEVIQFLVARYGEFVLLRPTFGAHTLVLWLTPIVLLGLTLLGIAWRVFGARRQASAPEPLNPEEQRRLARILDASHEK